MKAKTVHIARTAKHPTVLYSIAASSYRTGDLIVYLAIEQLRNFRGGFITNNNQHKLHMLIGYNNSFIIPVTVNHTTNDDFLYKLK